LKLLIRRKKIKELKKEAKGETREATITSLTEAEIMIVTEIGTKIGLMIDIMKGQIIGTTILKGAVTGVGLIGIIEEMMMGTLGRKTETRGQRSTRVTINIRSTITKREDILGLVMKKETRKGLEKTVIRRAKIIKETSHHPNRHLYLFKTRKNLVQLNSRIMERRKSIIEKIIEIN
jgi:hypothetical protein